MEVWVEERCECVEGVVPTPPSPPVPAVVREEREERETRLGHHERRPIE